MSLDKRNIKRRSFQKHKDFCRFKEVAQAQGKVDHEYNKRNQVVDWQDSAENGNKKYVKGKFCEDFLHAKCSLTTQISFHQKKINKTMNQVIMNCVTVKDIDT